MGKRKLSKKQINKRNEIADSIKRDNPGISDESKFKIATSRVKKGKRRGRR